MSDCKQNSASIGARLQPVSDTRRAHNARQILRGRIQPAIHRSRARARFYSFPFHQTVTDSVTEQEAVACVQRT